MTSYQKIVKYGLTVQPYIDLYEKPRTIVYWAVFSEIYGGCWYEGNTLQEAIKAWEEGTL